MANVKFCRYMELKRLLFCTRCLLIKIGISNYGNYVLHVLADSNIYLE